MNPLKARDGPARQRSQLLSLLTIFFPHGSTLHEDANGAHFRMARWHSPVRGEARRAQQSPTRKLSTPTTAWAFQTKPHRPSQAPHSGPIHPGLRASPANTDPTQCHTAGPPRPRGCPAREGAPGLREELQVTRQTRPQAHQPGPWPRASWPEVLGLIRPDCHPTRSASPGLSFPPQEQSR